MRSKRSMSGGRTALEIAAAVLCASLLAELVSSVTPDSSLLVVYLLAVLAVAIRGGLWPAIATAAISVAVFNFLFVEPSYQLSIARSEDLAALVVFLAAAVLASRLASIANDRARIAAARERETKVLADTASAALAPSGRRPGSRAPLEALVDALEEGGEATLTLVLGDRPGDSPDAVIVRFPTQAGPAWLRGRTADGWDQESLTRLAGPLLQLDELARERERLADRAAEVIGAERAEVARTALLHSISHDLRSPLTAISTAAAGMDPAAMPDEDQRSLLEVIREESERLGRLVDDLLDVSRIEAGAVDPRFDWCHLSEVASLAVATARERTDHPIELDLPSSVLLVRADPVQIERVFANLIDNAIKYSPPDSVVRVSGGSGHGRVQVRVTDSGRGIPLARRADVFKPFFRGRSSGEGSGLGLAISRGFVEANGGEIRVDDAAGGGTSFTVSFPLATTEPTRA